ncbi:ubiquitin-conjugating enzyme family protein, putative [Ichthyophthirius multifiliis]|uniref:E2 ubiquitin-conjugating enzyme n=1 Tax=Ichthyophthirius multifiliis TaxID=5932 RepID=G0QW25_ICHMU|nr:ubiquitin-conjugating enzyme family protein, putative [Ichthyophthirius multifiliis]EGR30577.1 ubiquitin-conjugating enzyme family protein, putative [Ichthyophthirius multifiliis]|eukprot:XP_004032164.1 ubiquitin-conjugating enzyme family protein, putative [Ichthyophthirius multifiliis]
MHPGQNKGRIQKEITDFHKTAETSNIKVQIVGNDLNHWKGYIAGPEDTPYGGGVFQIDIQLPSEYPYKPPKMKFDTRIWHPNISSQTGAICLDILKNEWSPALSIRTALLSLQALMCAPEPDDPQDAVVAQQYKNQKDQYIKTAKEWTKNYANTNAQDEKVKKLVEMGFEEKQCREALMKFGWEEELSLNYLLGGN